MSQLTNYIQKELDKGFNKELITKKLLQAGYTKQEIEESFTSLKAAEPLLRRKFLDTIHTDVHVRWSKWVFPLLAIGLLVFFGYLLFLYIEGRPAVEEVTLCDDISDTRERDICYLELAAQGEDVCSKIETDVLKTACEQKIWENDDCSYDFFIGKDFNVCLLQKAIETGNVKYCTMQEEHSDCLYQLATASKNYSLCQHDSDCLARYAIEQENPHACAEIYAFFQSQCYDEYALNTGDTSICEKGTFICGYPSSGTDEEKKAFIDAKISTLSTTIEEGDDLSVRDEYMYVAAEQFTDGIFCSYILNTELQQECTGEYRATT